MSANRETSSIFAAVIIDVLYFYINRNMVGSQHIFSDFIPLTARGTAFQSQIAGRFATMMSAALVS
jgi:hypothetical protein